MSKKIRQLHLGDMEHGLAKELAFFKLLPSQITELTGVTFEITRDDLDYCLGALLVTEDGRQFALRHYMRGPKPEVTELIGAENSECPKEDAELFLAALEIPGELVLWRHD